jgi:hypothetical protein
MKTDGTVVRLVCLSLMALLSAGARVRIDDVKAKLPETISTISEDDFVRKVPNFYYFDYGASDLQPGKRLWIRVNKKKWIERYPDGFQSIFLTVGHAEVDGIGGTIVVKVKGKEGKTGTSNDGEFQAFIPDKGSNRMHHLCRSTADGNTDWSDMGKMREVE